MKISNKSYLIIFNVALCLAIVFFVLWPNGKSIIKIFGDINNERINLEKLYLRGQRLKQIKQDFEAVKPLTNDLEKIFLAPGDELKIITTLEDIAAKSGVEQELHIANSQTSKTQSDEFAPDPLMLNLNLKSSFPQLLTYLINLEASDYYISINTMTINNKNADSQAPSIYDITNSKYITTNIKAQVYRFNLAFKNE